MVEDVAGDHVAVTVRQARLSDLGGIREVFDDWLGPEAAARTASVEQALARHIVAVVDSRVVGVAGLADEGISSELFDAERERPVEAGNVYVRRSHRGTGVGRALLDELEANAVVMGFTTLLVVSGSRNRESGYPFWRRRYGEPVRWDDDYFGPGQERVVWRYPLLGDG